MPFLTTRRLKDRIFPSPSRLPSAGVRDLAARLGVEMPICQTVAALLAGEVEVDAAILGLLARPLKSEA